MSIADGIVKVSITRQTGGLATKNFSTIMFLSKTATNVYKEYASASEVSVDGYSDTSDEYLSALSCFSQEQTPLKFAIGQWDSAGGDTITEALEAINVVSDKWYGLVIGDISVPADIVLAGTWARANKKFMFTAQNEAESLVDPDTTSVVYLLNNGGTVSDITYNSVVRNSTAQGFIDVAKAVYHLTRTPGSYVPAFKTLSTATPDALTGSQSGVLEGKQCNSYQEVSGRNMMLYGLATGSEPEWTDTYIGIDWLQARIQEEVMLLLANSPKIPYTNAGVAQIDSAVSAVLKRGVDNGFIASFTTSAEDTADQSAVDRAGRIYNGLTFTATIAGAIQSVTIKGIVRV